MYNEYFGFSEAPFSIAPDPRYLFMSERHREALAHLLYGLKIDGGFVLLTGEVGTGKTTVCRCLLEQVPDNCDIAFIFNPKLTTIELLSTICEELHIAVPSSRLSVKVFVDLINFHLLESNARDRKTVLIVDEAQNLSNEVLEQLRLLTNLETNQRKLLQIILLGQPELRERLADVDMRQLAQRIVARYHLEPLSRPEVGAYVGHRLSVAGARHGLFPAEVLERLYRLSRGTPRLINVICDRALLGAYVEGKPTVDLATLNKAAREVLGERRHRARDRSLVRWSAAAVLGLAAAVGLAAAYHRFTATDSAHSADQPAASPAASAPPPMPAAALIPSAAPVGSGDKPAESVAWPAAKDHWLHEALAVRGLFGLWRIDMPPTGIEAACIRAAEQGMQCLQGVGDVERLRAMNAPAVVELKQDGGPDFYATLVAVDGDVAHLLVGGEERKITLDGLRRQWSGRYALLWRGPPGIFRILNMGAQGADVAWVDRQLGRWEGKADPGHGGTTYTAALQQRVRAYQRAVGLEEDGVVGSMTMVRLASVGEPGTPVLAEGR